MAGRMAAVDSGDRETPKDFGVGLDRWIRNRDRVELVVSVGAFGELALLSGFLAVASFANWDAASGLDGSFLGLSGGPRYSLFAALFGYWAFRYARVAMRISERDVCLRGVASTRHFPLDEVVEFKVRHVTKWLWHLTGIVLVRYTDAPREFSLWIKPGKRVVVKVRPRAEFEAMSRFFLKKNEAKLEPTLEEMNRICEQLNGLLRSQRGQELGFAAETNYPY
jgi:hypothetical protein